VAWHEDCYAATDALGFCAFTSTASYNVTPARMAELFEYAMGIGFNEQDLMKAGRRIITLERCFNVREGYRRGHDTLPWRMMNDPIPDGVNKGLVTDKETLDKMLDEYFKLTGWDQETGVPTRKALERLGLLELCGDAVSA
jgi:aldehyde:ferredoxin oxidoreductase